MSVLRIKSKYSKFASPSLFSFSSPTPSPFTLSLWTAVLKLSSPTISCECLQFWNFTFTVNKEIMRKKKIFYFLIISIYFFLKNFYIHLYFLCKLNLTKYLFFFPPNSPFPLQKSWKQKGHMPTPLCTRLCSNLFAWAAVTFNSALSWL